MSGETLDIEFMDDLLEDTTCLTAVRCTCELDSYTCLYENAECNLVEVNMLYDTLEEILLVGLDENLVLCSVDIQ